MNVLHGKKETKTNEFRFNVNLGGDLDIKATRNSIVKIFFIDDKFSHVEHSLECDGFEPRSYFHVMQAINERITALEESIKNKQA